MDQIEQQPAGNPLTLTGDSLAHLRTASIWGRFLAILGFISSGLILLAAVSTFIFIRKTLPELPPRDPGVVYDDPGEKIRVVANAMPLFSLAVGVVYLYICVKLYRFADYTRKAVDYAQQGELDRGVLNLGAFFRTFGILAVVCLFFYLIMMFSVLGRLFTHM